MFVNKEPRPEIRQLAEGTGLLHRVSPRLCRVLRDEDKEVALCVEPDGKVAGEPEIED